MSEGIPTSPSELFQVSSEEIRKEDELGERGFIPERWLKIKEAETKRMQDVFEIALDEKTKNIDEQEFQNRERTLKRYFHELMLPPSFENGRYAAKHWLNLYELLPRIIDIEQDMALVPSVDQRVPFSTSALEKGFIIEQWLVQKVQSALRPEDAITDVQRNDCFTNISQRQLDVLIDQIGQSGLTIFADSPEERWQKLVRG